MPSHVDVYFSLISPWAYLGHDPLMALAAKHQFEIGWKPVTLPALFGETGGLPLAKRAIQRRRYRDVELMRWADRRGKPLRIRPKFWPFDAALADCVVIALLAAGKNPAGFIGAGFRAAWAEDRDMAARETLAELIEAQGFDPEATLEAARSDAIRQAYAANGEAAIRADVFGSPSYVLDGEVFWGQDRLDLLDHMLTSGRPPFRPIE
ncbi:2-hydroxychromene-2-carboxylate isomerase [Chelatococcus sambhunathii]|uniref:2-hydroxychromene-2-carboxylate isomerase n=1 Tax=Chelatococcus sambhunathii TaxID=363953 RepID=A0ABU1DKL3_9HYPH|nr:2-hydroxychromene-2-carboxylate isomerase [Chelatococcus sambhunathii]MDR4308656.1 2-hydroxychromene-2-carboxylate isomerase [Chelatococcus sambhunathii]